MEPLSGAGDSTVGWIMDMAASAGDTILNDLHNAKPDGLLDAAVSGVKEGGDKLETLPIIGQAVSGLQSAYHLGSAGYDAVTGDRDGAVSHFAQSAMDAAMVVPGANEVLGGVDGLLGHVGSAARPIAELAGVDSSIVDIIPTGLDDVMATASVTGVNALFGADDSDWFGASMAADALGVGGISADGKGTGTRAGEISFGMMAMNAMSGGPVSVAVDALMNSQGMGQGQLIADAFGVTNNRTSGVEDNLAAKAGQMIHEQMPAEVQRTF